MRKWAFISAGIIALILFSFLYGGENTVSRELPMINGVNIEAPPQPYDSTAFQNIKSTYSNWVALVPYAFTSVESANVVFDQERQWWGEKTEGIVASIEMAHQQGLEVMIKPHLWVRNQGWAGEFELKKNKDWEQWESAYRDYILHFAKIAEENKVSMLCIGTECRKVVVQRPEFWEKLIAEIRGIYHGKLTYAANWDNYQEVDFWHDLDFIGIDAYFPLLKKKTPEVNELTVAWQEEKENIKSLSGEYGKPVIFTEYGYQSIDYTATGHWDIDTDSLEVNYLGQSNGYQAIFDSFWHENWFQGGFLWKWHMHEERFERLPKHKFTPQRKPAMEIVTQQFQKDAGALTTN